MAAGCRGGPYPDPPPEGAPLLLASVGLNAVYADGSADRFNDAVFNGTLDAELKAGIARGLIDGGRAAVTVLVVSDHPRARGVERPARLTLES